MLRLIAELDPLDPRQGLACDEALLESIRRGGPDTVRIWVNRYAVVIGRSQSAAAEVDLARAAGLGLAVLRRISGGGAVVHYPGNLNVSICVGGSHAFGDVGTTFECAGGAVAAALRGFGMTVRIAGTRLLLGEEKIGGAAQARRAGALLYHTTLLVDPDPRRTMRAVLRALQVGYTPGRVASRPCVTTSLREAGYAVDSGDLVEPLGDAIAQLLDETVRPGELTQAERMHRDGLAVSKYGSDRWNGSR